MEHPEALVPPLYRSVNFAFKDTAQLEAAAQGAFADRFYTRLGNPTTNAIEARIAALEGAEAGLLFGSGMAAVATTALALASAGQRVAVDRRVYGGAASFFNDMAPRLGIAVELFSNLAEARQIAPGCRFYYFESPTNPRLDLIDISAFAKLAHSHGALAIMDGTLAGPIVQRPLERGVDLVIHSATKSLSGHHDVLAGAVVGPRDLIDPIKQTRTLLGGNLDPGAAALLGRGLITLELRVQRQCESAAQLASWLHQRRSELGLSEVYYPGLPEHPGHALAKDQMRGFGSLVTVVVEGGLARARAVADRLRHIKIAASLGGPDTLVSLPSLTSHIGWSDERLRAAGLAPGLLRFALGLEDPQVIGDDLARALAQPSEEGS